jgi:hypothetical protein
MRTPCRHRQTDSDTADNKQRDKDANNPFTHSHSPSVTAQAPDNGNRTVKKGLHEENQEHPYFHPKQGAPPL